MASLASTNPRVGYVVLGVRIDDAVSAQLSARLGAVTLAQSILALTCALLQIASGYPFALGLFPAVFLPLLGLCGVQQRARWAVLTFAVLCLMTATLFIISLIVTFATIGDYISCLCSTNCAHAHDLPTGDAVGDICTKPTAARAAFYIAVALGSVMAGLQVLGAIIALQLSKRRVFFEPALFPPTEGQAHAPFLPQTEPTIAAPRQPFFSSMVPRFYGQPLQRTYTYASGVASYQPVNTEEGENRTGGRGG